MVLLRQWTDIGRTTLVLEDKAKDIGARRMVFIPEAGDAKGRLNVAGRAVEGPFGD